MSLPQTEVTFNISPAGPAGGWPALAAAVRAAWHQHTHLHAGRWRLVQAVLQVGPGWPSGPPAQAALAGLAVHLASDGTHLDVLRLPAATAARLQLGWRPWHAPPPAEPATVLPPTVPPVDPPTPRKPTMKLPAFLNPGRNAAAGTAHADREPSLQPARNTSPQAQPLAQALSRIGEDIARAELLDLLDALPDCRYRLDELTLYISAANLALLRSLMDRHQTNPLVARMQVEKYFARGTAASLLDCQHLRLDFQRDASLPPEASEVLLSAGREHIALSFSYRGDHVYSAGKPAQPAAGPGVGAAPPAPVPAAAVAAAPAGAALLLWCQAGPGAALQRWRIVGGPAMVGAAADATIQIDQRHVSGRHLQLSNDGAGRWQVEDVSRNGTLLFDPVAAGPSDAAEQPLPARRPRPLPAMGALRLGPLADDPLLHFAQQALAPVATPADPPAPRRARATDVAVGALAARPVNVPADLRRPAAAPAATGTRPAPTDVAGLAAPAGPGRSAAH